LQEIRFSQLPKGKQTLIRLCQRVDYGSVLNVRVLHGDCDFGSGEVTLDVRLDTQVGSRQELALTDFVLPIESCRLLDQIDSVTNGFMEKINVHDGIRDGSYCDPPSQNAYKVIE